MHTQNIMNRQITITIENTPLPASINAVLHEAADNDFIICLNSEKTDDERAAGFIHECLHIYRDDFKRPEPADHIEQTRHNELLRLLQIVEQEATQK